MSIFFLILENYGDSRYVCIMQPQEIVEIHAIASGRVQGVGFRYVTVGFAREFKLQGTVQNLADGTVEIYAQGPKEKIDEFCNRLNEYWMDKMQPLLPTYLKTLHTYQNFSIKKSYV
jgi:acylphosphatase